MADLSFSRRLRRTPFSQGVEAQGVKAFTVYNRMLLPTVFEDVVTDYHHLKSCVQVWDVSVERQVEVVGPDATKLMQMLTPRDLSKIKEDQCFYVPIVDQNGGMLNDPVALQVDEDRWWVSIADSDLLFWAKGIALGLNLDVHVYEPDISPLAIQGPMSEYLLVDVFGEQARNLRFFRYKRMEFMGNKFIVARSGYSKQGGFEIYVEGSENGMPLWDALFEAGQIYDVRAGCPNLIERIEAGLLSYGNDMTSENNPYECGLERFCKPAENSDYIGRVALEKVQKNGPKQQIRAVQITGDVVPPCGEPWELSLDGKSVGQITSSTWSPDFNTNVSIGMVSSECWDEGQELDVDVLGYPRKAIVQRSFWI